MSSVRPFKLSRRSLLRGLGLALALPPLEAMFDGRGVLHGTASAGPSVEPKRLVIWHWPGGLPVSHAANDGGFWYPTQAGSDWQMTEGLTPLEAFRDDITLVSGLTYTQIANHNAGSHGHATALLTGYPAAEVAENFPTSLGPSADQLAAQRIGGATKLASIGTTLWEEDELGLNFSDAGVRTPLDWNPNVLYDRLFSDVSTDPAAATKALERNLSVLDFVKGDITRLQGRLGKADNTRLEQHMDAIRALEQQLTTPVGEGCVVPGAPADGVSFGHEQVTEYARLMMDLAGMALVCDISRVAFVSMGKSQNYTIFSHLGVPVDYHNVAHSNGQPGDLQATEAGKALAKEYYKKIAKWQMEQLAYFLGILKGDGGPGSLLDTTAFVALSEFSSGETHHDQYLPVITAGKLGGMTGGQNMVLPCNMEFDWQEPPWCANVSGTPNVCVSSLWQSALGAVGALEPEEVFGDPSLDTKPISGLWGT